MLISLLLLLVVVVVVVVVVVLKSFDDGHDNNALAMNTRNGLASPAR